MKKQHLWIVLKFELPLAVYSCHHCSGIKVREGSTKWTHSNGKFHYFYKKTTQRC